MAAAKHTAAVQGLLFPNKRCAACNDVRPEHEFPHRGSGKIRAQCRRCYRARARALYAQDEGTRQRAINRHKARMERLAHLGLAKDVKRRYRKAQRARYVAAGLTTNGTPRKSPARRRCTTQEMASSRNRVVARMWRRQWLRQTAPDPCVAAWYAGTGKPWNNCRLDAGAKFRLRYRMDNEFRAREIIKVQGRKVTRAARVAALSDGTVTPEALGKAFGEARFCAYCVEPFSSSTDKTADHVEPLYRGGAHSMENIVIACVSCNSSKGRKGLLQWLIANPPMSSSAGSTSSRSPSFSA